MFGSRDAAKALDQRGWVRPIALAAAVGIAYSLTARLSFDLKSPSGVAVFWPAAGIAAGTLIALGRSARWPVALGVLTAILPANLTGDRNILASTIFALTDVGEALLVAWMIQRYIGSDFDLGRLRHVLGLLAAAIGGTAVSGLVGAVAYKLSHSPGESVSVIWQQWIASNALGIISIAPLIVAIAGALRAPPTRCELTEGIVALIAVAATTNMIIFMLPSAWWETSVLIVLLFPLVLWVAARCQPVFASAIVFVVSFIVIVTVTFRLGNFGNAASSMNDGIVSAEITILSTALSAFILSALFAERRQHEAILVASETRLQDALAIGAVLTFDWDPRADLVLRSNNAPQILGYDPQRKLDSKSFFARVHPDDLSRLRGLMSSPNRDNSTYSITFRFLRFDGSEIWLQETGKAEFDPAGRIVRVKGMALDITERKRAEEHQKTLMAELDHRVKNVLARVDAVADSTWHSGGPAEFIRSYKGRIQSMAIAHDLLSETAWHGADLATLVRKQLSPYAAGANTTIAGPEIKLSASATQALAIVLHELVTNAAKYGALSIPSGAVAVSWDRRPTGPAATLILEWREHGGPPVASKVQSSYGTDLIRNLIPHELGGSVNLVFAAEGVSCRIEIPVEQPASAGSRA